MSAAAVKVYDAVRKEGTQKSVVDLMQTRAELYDTLSYEEYEKKLDELFKQEAEDWMQALTRKMTTKDTKTEI